jgi:hypothetical protein
MEECNHQLLEALHFPWDLGTLVALMFYISLLQLCGFSKIGGKLNYETNKDDTNFI